MRQLMPITYLTYRTKYVQGIGKHLITRCRGHSVSVSVSVQIWNFSYTLSGENTSNSYWATCAVQPKKKKKRKTCFLIFICPFSRFRVALFLLAGLSWDVLSACVDDAFVFLWDHETESDLQDDLSNFCTNQWDMRSSLFLWQSQTRTGYHTKRFAYGYKHVA